MASRTVTVITCDLCGATDRDGATLTEHRLCFDGPLRLLDLCDRHDVELLVVQRWADAGTDVPFTDLPQHPRRRRARRPAERPAGAPATAGPTPR